MKKVLEELIEAKAKELKELTNPEELGALAELVKAYSTLPEVGSADLEGEVIAGLLVSESRTPEVIHLRKNGRITIDNVTEGYQFEGPVTIKFNKIN